MKAKLLYLLLGCSLILGACASHRPINGPDCITSITLVDRHGMSETISSGERLARYQQTDFLQPQTHEKVLRIYGRDETGGIFSCVTGYHPNGQVKQYLEAYNGQAVGTYQEWFANGQQKLDAHVVGGLAEIGAGAESTWLFDGLCQAWDEEGNLLAEIPYSKGQQEGIARHYHKDGSLWKETPYRNGLIHGISKTFLATGQLLEAAHYVKGDRHGETRRFWTKERVSSLEIYKGGLLVSGSYYDLPGALLSRIENGNGHKAIFSRLSVARMEEYKGGRPEGRVRVYNSDDQLVRSYHVKDGLKHGEEIEYYGSRLIDLNPKGEPQARLSVNWHEGEVTGLSRSWYESGQLESQREMSGNKKQGVCTAWYQDGSLMFIEEYDNDKLVSGKYLRPGDHIPITRVSEGSGIATLHDPDGNFIRKLTYEEGLPVEQ